MSDFLFKKLKDIVYTNRPVTYGIVQPGPNVAPDGIPLIRGKDYSNGRVLLEGLYYVLPEIDRPYSRSKVFADDILLSIVGYVGKVAVVPEELEGANITQTTARLSIDPEKIWPKYVYHSLNAPSFSKKIKKYEKGSAQPGLNLSDVEKLEIKTINGIFKQKKISNILDTVDQTIEKTEILIHKYQQIKTGLMHDLFTRGVTNDGTLRPSREQVPELYKETPIGWIPKEWDLIKAGDVITTIDAGKSPDCPNQSAGTDQWGILKVSAVAPDGLKQTENKVVEKIEFQNPTFKVKRGDLLITRANTPELVGMICHVGEVRNNLILSDKTLRLNVDSNLIDKRFLYWGFQCPEIRKQIEIKATGSSGSMKNISQKDIRDLLICIPKDLYEQNRIKQRLDSVLCRLNN